MTVATPVELSLRDRRAILDHVLTALRKRFYRPDKLNAEWDVAVERHRPLIESAKDADAFEQSMSNLLAELGTSHLGFFHASARRASSRAALSATYLADQTPFGYRWIFQDVHSGGAAAIAGIESGDILLMVDGQDVIPPTHPVFPMGKSTEIEIVGKGDLRRRVTVDVARPTWHFKDIPSQACSCRQTGARRQGNLQLPFEQRDRAPDTCGGLAESTTSHHLPLVRTSVS